MAVAFYGVDPTSSLASVSIGGRVEICWGGPGLTYTKQTLTQNAAGARHFSIVDVDKDGWLDLYVVYHALNIVVCWYIGPNRVAKEKIILQQYLSPVWVVSADMDNNGFPDAVISLMDSELIIIVLNLNGKVIFLAF